MLKLGRLLFSSALPKFWLHAWLHCSDYQKILWFVFDSIQARNQEGHFPPEIFKTLHNNFDICKNFQKTKMKFYILIIFKKSYWNFLCLAR